MWLQIRKGPLILYDCEDHSQLAHLLQKVWLSVQLVYKVGEDVLGQTSQSPLQVLLIPHDHVFHRCHFLSRGCIPQNARSQVRS